MKKPALYGTYRPVNLVKNGILNYCSLRMQKQLRREKMAPMYLWGLLMSGRMDERRVRILLPEMERYAQRRGRDLEILFHPGQVQKEEITPEFSQKEAIAFHVSEDRRTEKASVMGL